jgi:predicted peroxiredoxin
VTEIAEAATALGIKVEIFLMDQGIYNLIDDRFKKLTTSGVDISFCSLNAEQKKITGITIGRTGSQLDHAEIVKKCDRYLGFFR